MSFNIKHLPGHQNPADWMSRHPILNTRNAGNDVAEQYVNFVAESCGSAALTLADVCNAAANDKAYSKALELVQSGKWHVVKDLNDSSIDIGELKEIGSVRDELASHPSGLLLKGAKIVLPKGLREQAISIAHEGHQGMNRTKSFIRSKVWFPGINEQVENAIRNCTACQLVHSDPVRLEPLCMSELPEGPWQNLSADFCGPLPTGEYLFVVIDEYSRYPLVEIVRSTSASTAIPVLDKILSEWGGVKQIKTDNGSPFNSHAFAEFAKYSGFRHRKITPRWPRANAQAEAFNKPFMKAVRTAVIERKHWKQELYKFL